MINVVTLNATTMGLLPSLVCPPRQARGSASQHSFHFFGSFHYLHKILGGDVLDRACLKRWDGYFCLLVYSALKSSCTLFALLVGFGMSSAVLPSQEEGSWCISVMFQAHHCTFRDYCFLPSETVSRL